MNNLNATEQLVLNNASMVLNPTVKLGDKLKEIINSLPVRGTPVNAVAASMLLTFSGPVVHGESLTIYNPSSLKTDVYEFLTDDAQVKSVPSNIAVDISADATKAQATLTVDTQPTSGDTMTIGEKTYIFVPHGTDTADGEISIGLDLATAQEAIVAAVNGTDGVNTPHPAVVAGDFVQNDSRLTALIGGTVGNLIPTLSGFTAVTNVFDDVTLTLGTDCAAVDAIAALLLAISEYDTAGVVASPTLNQSELLLTSKVAGKIGNIISITETIENAAFTNDAVLLAGGVDGTVAVAGAVMADANYLYICVDGNTVADRNWARIALAVDY